MNPVTPSNIERCWKSIRFLGECSLVVRPLDPRLGKVPNISAAALMDDGSPVLIVDVEDLVRSIAKVFSSGQLFTGWERNQRSNINPSISGMIISKKITVGSMAIAS